MCCAKGGPNRFARYFAGPETMYIRIVSRCSAVLLLAGMVAACSSNDSRSEQRAMRLGGDCYGNRSSCMYEGRYESGERAYAEEEAKRLNRAALQRLRRGG